MGCFTVENGYGAHAHELDDVTISARTGEVIAKGPYNTYGWVAGDFHDDLDVHSVAMMLEDGIAPKDLLTTDPTDYRTKFFEDYGGNEHLINKHMHFDGFTGDDSECEGCQSIWFGDDEEAM